MTDPIQEDTFIHVTLNGEVTRLPVNSTVAEAVQTIGALPDQVAVLRNGHVVPRTSYASQHLGIDDDLEILTFAGGG